MAHGLDPVEAAWVRASVRRRLFGGDPPPVTIGRFQLRGPLGAGAMGSVWAAHDPELEREIALKVLFDDHGADRLLREAQAMARIRHPNVVHVYEVARWEGRPFIVMERVEGPSLRAWLAASPRDVPEVLSVFAQAARALAAAHAAGVVHRDFKPENVLVDTDGHARVADFGLASGHVDGTETHFATATTGAGTPAYMAPEQLRGEAATARSDQFALCVALYEALYGTRPFDERTRAARLAAIERGELPAGTAIGAIPAAVRRAVERGLAADPARRHPDLATLARALAPPPDGRPWVGSAIGLAAVAAAAVVLAVRVERAPAPPICGGGPAALAGAWDAARRADVQRAFATATRPYAAMTGARTRAALDAYAASWATMHRASCVATEVDRTQPAEIAVLRLACLDDRRRQLRALVDEIARGEPDVLVRAARAVAELPPLERCADVAALRLRTPPPPPAVAVALAPLRDVLANARAALLAGRDDDALAIARDVLPHARAAGHAPFVAEVELALGQAAFGAGDYAAGKRALEHAHHEAIAGRDDAMAAEAAIALAHGRGHLEGEAEDGARWLRAAEALVRRVATDDVLRARYANVEGNLAQDAGTYDAAIAAFARAAELWQRLPGDHRIPYGGALLNRGNSLNLVGRTREALASIEAARAAWRAALGPDHPLQSLVEGALARTHSALGDRPRAIAHAERALAIDLAHHGEQHPSTAMSIGALGVQLLDADRPAEALPHFERAGRILAATVGPDHPLVAGSRSNEGLALLALGRLEAAEARLTEALATKTAKLGDRHPSLATTLEALGDVALARKDPATALARFTRALALMEAAAGSTSPELSASLIGLGRAHLALRQPAAARRVLTRAVAVLAGADPKELARAQDLLRTTEGAR